MKKAGFEKYAIASEVMAIIQDLCDIAGYGIHSGIKPGASGNRAAEYILKKLHAAGLENAHLEPIRVNNPFPDSYAVVVHTGDDKTDLSGSCCPIQWTVGTNRAGVTGELAYVGDGAGSRFENVDVAGKIALIDEKFMRGYIATAKEASAIAQAKGALAVFRANMIVDSPQQQKHEGTPACLYPIPAFCFSSSAGDFLRNLAKSGSRHSVAIRLDVPHDTRKAYNIVFDLPGNECSREVLLVGTHYDTGHFTGAVDNNASVALMIRWARHFASKPRSARNRRMIFAWCMGHDCDLNSGHYQFAAAHKEQLSRAIVWDVDHAVGGVRYIYDASKKTIVPLDGETCEFYIISNNYSFSKLAAFTMDKYGFTCTHNRFESTGRGPQWGMAPDTCPWVNVASIPLYYHSVLDTPDKITPDQIERAYSAHMEILENVDRTPDGFLYYDNMHRNAEGRPPRVEIAVLSPNVRAGDTLHAWNDETKFYSEKTSYHCPALPEWAGTTWDWGDGSPVTVQGPIAHHVYAVPGNYVITLKFTDISGNQAQATKKITVTE